MELITCRPMMRYSTTKSNFLLLAFASFEAGVFLMEGHLKMTEQEAKEFFAYPNGEYFQRVVANDSSLFIWPSGYAISTKELYAKSIKEGQSIEWGVELNIPRSLG